jgi:hypothetical protein
MRLSRISRTMTHIGYNKTEARHPKHKSKEGVQMGASLDAYIEYDDSPMYYQTGEVPPPFTWVLVSRLGPEQVRFVFDMSD